jgi:trehalose/maltose hydrolase-like predicted phosphorylase
MYGAFEHHITGDVAIAVWQYYCVTQDLDWLREKGYPMLEAIATYWVSRSEQNEQGEYEIRNVIGADEWNVNALGGKNVNNNAYTNGVAKTSLEVACKAARLLELKPEPIWETVARKLLFSCMPNGVTAEHDTYKGEKTKQADVCLLAFPLRIITDKAQIKKDLEYYLQTVPKKKTPAMSKSVYSILYARLGDRERAFYYFEDSYLPNLNPPFRVVAEFDGGTNPYFITGAGGTLQTILFGFGGLDITDKGIIAGKGLLPSTWKSLMLKGIGKDKKTYLVK